MAAATPAERGAATEVATKEAVPEEAEEAATEVAATKEAEPTPEEGQDTPPHLQKPVATGIMSTVRTLGSVWNPSPAPGKTRSKPEIEGPTSLAKNQ